jgi:putative hydrolase of the HAD superfamily
VSVRAVLLDADGVLQRNPDGWIDRVRGFVAPADAEAFTADLWDAEHAALRGECAFADVVAAAADRWGFRGREGELAQLWRCVEVDDEVRGVVADLRAAGLGVHLATNQNDQRASYLRDELGYDELFDRCFCSCEVGATKEDPAFFTYVLRELALPAGDVLLVDDRPAYADTARSVGLRAVTWELGDGVPELERLLAGQGVSLG